MSSDAVAEMAFIDLAFHQNDERSDVVQFRVKLRVKKNDNLRIVLGRAVRKLLLNEETEINKSGEVEDDGDVSALTNLSDLPSHKTESEKGLTKTEKGRETQRLQKSSGRISLQQEVSEALLHAIIVASGVASILLRKKDTFKLKQLGH